MAANSYSGYVSVVVDGGLDRPLDYGIPLEYSDEVDVGTLVRVPLRGRECRALVLERRATSACARVRSILEVSEIRLPPDLVRLALWMSSYYATPLPRIFQVIVPSALRGGARPKEQLWVERAATREKLRQVAIELRSKAGAQAALLDTLLPHKGGMLVTELLEKSGATRSSLTALESKKLIKVRKVVVERSPIADQEYFRSPPKKLGEEQAAALQDILASMESRAFATHLLFGITGSGKTEVYLQAIERALAEGRGVIVLVPEISLTGQTVERFRSRFEGRIAVLHHRLSPGERYDEWHRIMRGEARIVIGARSALFSPVPNLGLLIVDEEHESSYKQSDGSPCYHGRDVAVMRAHLAQCTAVLGSATPSLESFHNCQNGKYRLNRLTSRAENAQLPKVRIIDMREAQEKSEGYTLFSDPLLAAMKQRYEVGEQTLLLLNRRGYHTSQWCPRCGEATRCPHCDIALTFHRRDGRLACHLCDYHLSPPPRHCTSCGDEALMRFRGTGTEQVERALHALLPDLRTLRIDSDTTRHKGSCEQLLRQFRSGKADVLVGTQMIAKGLHFPQVTLVGVLQADAGLQIPDYRASEQFFQLVTQVAGRAGRGPLTGEVIFQTYLPDHATLRLAARHDYGTFFEQEIESRKLFGYPPFTHLVKLTFRSMEEALAQEWAERYHALLCPLLAKGDEALPVVPSGQPKLKDFYRFQLLLRGSQAQPLVAVVRRVASSNPLPRTVQMAIDVDPVSLI